MMENGEFFKWVRIPAAAQQVYELPAMIPWPGEGPVPAAGETYINLSGLAAGIDLAEELEEKWGSIRKFCQKAEEASVHMERFEYLAALDALEEAEESHPCAYIHWQRCVCHLELRQPQQAEAAIHHATVRAPKNPAFLRIRGEIFLSRGMEDSANADFIRAFHLGERSASVIAGMVRAGELVELPTEPGIGKLISPAVSRAILKTKLTGVVRRDKEGKRIRELVDIALLSHTTGEVALLGTEALVFGRGGARFDDYVRHALALYYGGGRVEASYLLEQLVDSIRYGASIGDGDRFANLYLLLNKTIPEEVISLLVQQGKLSRKIIEKALPRERGESQAFAKRMDCPEAWAAAAEFLVSEGFSDDGRRACDEAVARGANPETLTWVAKTLIFLDEGERACACLSKIKEDDRSAEANFLFGEALWRIGHPSMARAAFHKVGKEADEQVLQNSQMREAQCDGLLQQLPEALSLSPTGRLSRPLLLAGENHTTLMAPMGATASSCIRAVLPEKRGGQKYKIFEYSRDGNEVVLADMIVLGKHDAVSVAIEPSGTVFAGAKLGAEWVPVTVEKPGWEGDS